MCQSMVDIQNAAAEIRRGKKKKKEERRTNHSMKIYMVSLFHRATINKSSAAAEMGDLGSGLVWPKEPCIRWTLCGELRKRLR